MVEFHSRSCRIFPPGENRQIVCDLLVFGEIEDEFVSGIKIEIKNYVSVSLWTEKILLKENSDLGIFRRKITLSPCRRLRRWPSQSQAIPHNLVKIW